MASQPANAAAEGFHQQSRSQSGAGDEAGRGGDGVVVAGDGVGAGEGAWVEGDGVRPVGGGWGFADTGEWY